MKKKHGKLMLAVHIHEGGSCGDEGFALTGGHYNPKEKAPPNHAGNLPPLMRYGDHAFWRCEQTAFVCGKSSEKRW